jgi:tetratricopeptide (TPR) repeat protein
MDGLEPRRRGAPFTAAACGVQPRCSVFGRWTRQLGLALALGLAAGPAAAAATPAQQQADRVIADFGERVDPPATRLAFARLDAHEAGAPLRAHVRRRHAQAVLAVLARAAAPGDAARVAKVLRQLDVQGRSVEAERWLADPAAADPQALRHLVALGELPAALALRLSPGDDGLRLGGQLGRDGQPMGRLAESDLRRVIQAAPDDAAARLELAWVVQAQQATGGEAEARAAIDAAHRAGDGTLLALAWQQLARVLQAQGRHGDAVAAAATPVQLARARRGDPQAEASLAHALARLAEAQAADGRVDDARRSLDEALVLHDRLVAAQPDEVLPALDRIGAMLALDRLHGAGGSTSPGGLQGRALQAYLDLEARTPWQSPFSRHALPGMIAGALVQAGVFTLAGGLLLLALYRWRVGRWMTAAAQASAAGPMATPAPASAAPPQRGEPLITSAASALRQAVVVQVAAGAAFGLLAAWLWLWASDTEPSFNRVAIIGLSQAWPTTLVLCLLWAGDRRRQAAVFGVYFALLGLVSLRIVWAGTPPMTMFGMTVPAVFHGLVLWFGSVGFSPFLLLFLNRRVRSVGPPLLLMMGVACAGGLLAQVLAFLPVNQPFVVRALSALAVPQALTIPAITLVGMVAFLPLAWAAAALLRAVHDAKWINDQSMVIDSIWLFQTLLLCSSLVADRGLAGWVGLAAFALVKAVSVVGMLPLARRARRRPASPLLLLRVFRRQRSSERLFDLLGARWRHAGPIRMIGAPDLASSTMDPDEFLDFLAGRLRRRFILDAAGLQQRLARMDDRPDLDGRFRVTDLFCGNDVWQAAVRALMARSDLVAMDLRGFAAQNQGCRFELQALLDGVPCRRIALLVDRSTDRALLDATLQAGLAAVPAESPNRDATALADITLLDAGTGELPAVRQLLHLAAALAGAQANGRPGA